MEPVEIVILPSGKSLDVCAEMREAKKLRKPLEEERKRKKRKLGKGLPHQQQVAEIHLLNSSPHCTGLCCTRPNRACMHVVPMYNLDVHVPPHL